MSLELFYILSRVPEMSSRATLFAANNTNTPFKEYFEVLTGTFFKIVPLLLDKHL